MKHGREKAKLGIITIGQSPRDDVLPDFIAALGYEPIIEQRGLLDDLSMHAIESLAPRSALDEILVTRLRDGTEVKLSEKRLIEMLPQAVEYLERKGVDVIALFCTGEFPPVESRVPVLYPSLVLSAVVRSLFLSRKNRAHTLCVVAPVKEQFGMLAKKWSGIGCALAFESLSPYTSLPDEIAHCATRVARLESDLVVLDCFGYTEKMRATFTAALDIPVILPRSLLARIVAEVMAK
jgi:protein AroM